HAIALTSLAMSLHTVEGAGMLANGWTGLAAAVLIGASLLLSGWLGMGPQLRLVAEGKAMPPWSLASSLGLLAGLAVVNLSLLFVMRAEHAALVWPWVGLAALWLALRLRHAALAIAWFALQLVSAVATLRYGPVLWGGDPHATAPGALMWGPLVLTLAGAIAGDRLQRAARSATAAAWSREAALQWGVVLWAVAWWANVLPPELHRQLVLQGALP